MYTPEQKTEKIIWLENQINLITDQKLSNKEDSCAINDVSLNLHENVDKSF